MYNLADLVFVSWKKGGNTLLIITSKTVNLKHILNSLKTQQWKSARMCAALDCGLIGGFKSFHVVLPIVSAEET